MGKKKTERAVPGNPKPVVLKFRAVGNSYLVTIPVSHAVAIGLAPGDNVAIGVKGNQIVIQKVSQADLFKD